MDIPMVNVSARIMDQRGRPVQRARITMRLTNVERYCGLVVPHEVEAHTDKDGLATLRVWPNELGSEGSEYQVTISFSDACQSRCPNHPSGSIAPIQNQRFRCVVPNADCNLQDIAELPPYEQRSSGQVITAEVAAYASQAASAADRADNILQSVGCIRVTLEGLADEAESAKVAAQEAARQASAHERRAQELVDGIDDKVCHFENSVTARTEKTAKRMMQEARDCIVQEKASALEAIEARTGTALSEISGAASDAQKTTSETINAVRENALGSIEAARKDALEDIAEEVRLAHEDFDAITDLANSAAKRAGCSAASAANARTDACACAERAEKAAAGMERFSVEAQAAAESAATSAACAKTDAQRAETAANTVQSQVESAKASADVAMRQAQLAKASADAAGLSETSARDAATSAQENREHVDEVTRNLDQKLKDAAAEIVTDEIVEAATAKATEEANAAKDAATEAAAAAAESAASMEDNAASAAASAANAASSAADAAEYASKLKEEFDAEVAVAAMAKEIIDLSDRLTTSQIAGLMAFTAVAELQGQVISLSDRVTGMQLAAMN